MGRLGDAAHYSRLFCFEARFPGNVVSAHIIPNPEFPALAKWPLDGRSLALMLCTQMTKNVGAAAKQAGWTNINSFHTKRSPTRMLRLPVAFFSNKSDPTA
jgi:hypothetical protein